MNREVNKAWQIIEEGGLILYPTDTIWGIGCDATNKNAIKRIYDLKQRDDAKSLIILLAEEKDIFRYVANPHPDIVNIVKEFIRPTTVIYDQAVGLPDNLVSQDGTIAIRVTKDKFCKSLIKRMKKPLVSTSANISGKPSPFAFNQIDDVIKNGVDHIVALRLEEINNVPPSTIVRINDDGTIDRIRP